MLGRANGGDAGGRGGFAVAATGRREAVQPPGRPGLHRRAGPGRVVPPAPARSIRDRLRSDRLRPLRFAVVGGLCGALQLAALAGLLRVGVPPLIANVAAFSVAAQLNFALSLCFTWSDRAAAGGRSARLVRRWLGYHGAIAGAAALNQIVFAVARLSIPALPAAALGIGAAALVNFCLQDRLIFRRSRRR